MSLGKSFPCGLSIWTHIEYRVKISTVDIYLFLLFYMYTFSHKKNINLWKCPNKVKILGKGHFSKKRARWPIVFISSISCNVCKYIFFIENKKAAENVFNIHLYSASGNNSCWTVIHGKCNGFVDDQFLSILRFRHCWIVIHVYMLTYIVLLNIWFFGALTTSDNPRKTWNVLS